MFRVGAREYSDSLLLYFGFLLKSHTFPSPPLMTKCTRASAILTQYSTLLNYFKKSCTEQIELGLALSKCCGFTRRILTTVITHIVDKSTDNALNHIDLFFTTISTSKEMFLRAEKRNCVTNSREQHSLDSYREWQSHCEISSYCGEKHFFVL